LFKDIGDFLFLAVIEVVAGYAAVADKFNERVPFAPVLLCHGEEFYAQTLGSFGNSRLFHVVPGNLGQSVDCSDFAGEMDDELDELAQRPNHVGSNEQPGLADVFGAVEILPGLVRNFYFKTNIEAFVLSLIFHQPTRIGLKNVM